MHVGSGGDNNLCAPVEVSIFSEYLTALYWSAMTISTVGYGDVAPQTDAERAYVVCGLFIGASFFSYIVGSNWGPPPPPQTRPGGVRLDLELNPFASNPKNPLL